MDIQPACPSLSADTIESFPVEPPVLYDDIQDEAITSGHKDTDLTLSDPTLDCDCHVSVYIIARVTFGHLSTHVYPLQVEDDSILCDGGCMKWYHTWYVNY
jgi:hypothetical protein